MKIETQPLEDHQVKLIVEVDPEPVEQAKRRAARQIARRTKIPGFRPGKAPYNIVQRMVGDEAILEEGLEILVKDLYPQILEEANVRPYGPGRFENIANLEPLTLEFVVPLEAEVDLGDYRSIRIPYELDEVSEEQVEEVLQNLRERQAIEEPVERPVEPGDRVFVRISASRLKTEEGQEPSLFQDQSRSFIIREEDGFDEDTWPFPGFSRQLIGISAGEEKYIPYTFPEDSDFTSLQGVPVEFRVVIEEVKSRTLAELNDEFAQSVGEYETLNELRAEIRNNLEQQARDAYHSVYDDQIVKQVIESSAIKYSPQMIQDEIGEVIHQLEHRLKGQNLDIETYLKTRNMEMEDLREEVTPVAEARLMRSLALLEIAQAENIQVEKEELQAETERTLQAMTRFMSEAEMRKISPNDLIPNLVGNIMADMKITRTLEQLRTIARGELEDGVTSQLAVEDTEAAVTKEEGDEVAAAEMQPMIEEVDDTAPPNEPASPQATPSETWSETPQEDDSPDETDNFPQVGEAPGE